MPNASVEEHLGLSLQKEKGDEGGGEARIGKETALVGSIEESEARDYKHTRSRRKGRLEEGFVLKKCPFVALCHSYLRSNAQFRYL